MHRVDAGQNQVNPHTCCGEESWYRTVTAICQMVLTSFNSPANKDSKLLTVSEPRLRETHRTHNFFYWCVSFWHFVFSLSFSVPTFLSLSVFFLGSLMVITATFLYGYERKPASTGTTNVWPGTCGNSAACQRCPSPNTERAGPWTVTPSCLAGIYNARSVEVIQPVTAKSLQLESVGNECPPSVVCKNMYLHKVMGLEYDYINMFFLFFDGFSL